VFLTAAHCVVDFETEDVDPYVTFDPAFNSGSTLIAGTIHIDPAYRQAQSDPNDLAVITFSSDVSGVTPAALPTLGQLNNAQKGAKFTAVGYGDVDPTFGGGPPVFDNPDNERRYAVSALQTVNRAWLRLSQNAVKGNGGTCYGDSGGPNFIGAGLGETNVVAALTNTGDAQCVATSVVYRLDTSTARSFLDDFVSVP
jgi:hypothetical protein